MIASSAVNVRVLMLAPRLASPRRAQTGSKLAELGDASVKIDAREDMASTPQRSVCKISTENPGYVKIRSKIKLEMARSKVCSLGAVMLAYMAQRTTGLSPVCISQNEPHFEHANPESE